MNLYPNFRTKSTSISSKTFNPISCHSPQHFNAKIAIKLLTTFLFTLNSHLPFNAQNARSSMKSNLTLINDNVKCLDASIFYLLLRAFNRSHRTSFLCFSCVQMQRVKKWECRKTQKVWKKIVIDAAEKILFNIKVNETR